jgi:hypothetical protein
MSAEITVLTSQLRLMWHPADNFSSQYPNPSECTSDPCRVRFIVDRPYFLPSWSTNVPPRLIRYACTPLEQ